MFAFNFGRKVRRVARRQQRHDKIDRKTYQKIVDGSRDPVMVAKWKRAVESGVSGAPWTLKTGMDWREMLTAIWDWFIENWPTILKIILSLLVFIEPPPNQTTSRDNRPNGRRHEGAGGSGSWTHLTKTKREIE